MLTTTFDLSNFEQVEIIPIGDLHFGNPLCDEQLFKDTIEYIKEENENEKCARICLLNGDLGECITKSSIGDVFEGQVYTPHTQIALITKYLLPLTEKTDKYPNGKIMSNCYGNHDHFRQYKNEGISVSTTIACNLGLQEVSSSDGCYTFLKLKGKFRTKDKVIFTIYNQHMTGGGTTIGSKANRVGKISNGIFADLIVGSHVHTPLTFKEDFIVPSTNTQTLRQQQITYVITNSFLRYGDYAQRSGMKPSNRSVPRIYLYQDKEVAYRNNTRVIDNLKKKIDVII